MTELYKVLSGLVLLTLGRRLFWLFIALAGFLAGIELAGESLSGWSPWLMLLAASVAGLVGALFAIFAHRLAFALAGFVAGCYLALAAARSFEASGMFELFAVIGGVAGMLAAVWFMDWAIIVLSSLAGSGAVVDAMNLENLPGFLLFVVLASAGVFFQGKLMENHRTRTMT